jgi:oligoribonuclease NrnB/cAMP/cGMP phosphodiesterase (DHH superfamily)
MISTRELAEIRDKLESSQNPLFLFDNDADGLCAFLILRRAVGRGEGVAIKSFPDLKEQYLSKVEEHNPDVVFVLDKAEVSPEFLKGVKEKEVPIVWIDHHKSKTSKELSKEAYYYNSLPTAEPTTYIAQRIFNKKEDLWLAMIGCTSDVYMPDFAKDFEKNYPELFNSKISAFEAYNTTEIGKVARMLNFGLMDSTTNIINLIKYLCKAKNLYDLLEENLETKQLHKRYSQLNDFFKKQIEKAESNFDKKSRLLFYSYSGNTSMSSEIANALCYSHPDKIVIVAFKRPEKVNISIRGKNALEFTQKLVDGIEGATGGGHMDATGAMIPIDEFEGFKKRAYELSKDF